LELIEPNISEDVVLQPSTKETIDTLLKQVDKKVIAHLREWGIKDKKSGIQCKDSFVMEIQVLAKP